LEVKAVVGQFLIREAAYTKHVRSATNR
jgi:hypothetical protein